MKWEAISKVGAIVISAAVAIGTWLAGRRKDKIAARSGALANGRAGVEQAFTLLDETINNLRDDKREQREDFRLERIEMREALEMCRSSFAAYVRDHPDSL